MSHCPSLKDGLLRCGLVFMRPCSAEKDFMIEHYEGAVRLVNGPYSSLCSKHIDVRYVRCRVIQNGEGRTC